MPLLNLLRPSLVLFAVALALACLGIVLYNVALSSLAAGIAGAQLCASRTRARMNASAAKHGAQPQRLPIGEAFVDHDVGHRQRQQRGAGQFRRRRARRLPRHGDQTVHEERHDRRGQRRKRKIAIARIEDQPERRLHRQQHDGDQQHAGGQRERIAYALRAQAR